MMRIHKFQIEPDRLPNMQRGARPLSVGIQRGEIVCWALVDAKLPPHQPRRIVCYGTGHDMPEALGMFLGTVQMPSGLVWHFFDQGDAFSPNQEAPHE